MDCRDLALEGGMRGSQGLDMGFHDSETTFCILLLLAKVAVDCAKIEQIGH